jgi:hypothetical protein
MVRAEFDRIEEASINLTYMWRWLLAVGLLTETFATHDQLEPLQRQSSFTAGLLHQIGRLSLAAKMAALYDRVVEAVLNGTSVEIADKNPGRELTPVDRGNRRSLDLTLNHCSPTSPTTTIPTSLGSPCSSQRPP